MRRRFLTRWWAIGLLSIPLLGVVAAFGIAPDTPVEQILLHRVIENIALRPIMPSVPMKPARFWREERVQRGDTIESLLARLQIDDTEAVAYLRSASDVRSLYRLIPGRAVKAVVSQDGGLISLRYLQNDGELLIQRSDDGFFSIEQAAQLERRLLMSSGQIESSLFAATDSAGLTDSIAIQLADIFSSEMDFHRDLQPGDRFAVVFEAFYDGPEMVHGGRIVAAEFINQDTTYQALYFEDPQGRNGYYTPEGKNIRKSFLRSPLEFSRISSGFSLARFHPILNTWRAHKGVDYSAPSGTRVKATADGMVQLAGRQNGYGNVVVLKHANGHATLYGHLSGFARGLRAGERVNQGDLIGFVGMSGLATGPHLHYEFKVNGVHKDPLRFATQPGPTVTAVLKPEFKRATTPLLERLSLIRGMNLALAN